MSAREFGSCRVKQYLIRSLSSWKAVAHISSGNEQRLTSREERGMSASASRERIHTGLSYSKGPVYAPFADLLYQ